MPLFSNIYNIINITEYYNLIFRALTVTIFKRGKVYALLCSYHAYTFARFTESEDGHS